MAPALFRAVAVRPDSGLLAFLASPRLTIFNFTLLILNALLIKPLKIESMGFFSLVLLLMFANLTFCMIKRRFASRAVTVFHLALLLFIASVWLSSLFYFYGYMELAEGQRDGVQRFVKGLLHNDRIRSLVFRQGKVDLSYSSADVTGFRSSLSIENPDGSETPVTIQFLKSFEWKGYNFYLHRDRGYAVELEFRDDLKKKRGFVDLPDYVRNPEGQTKYFDIPGESIGLVASLKIDRKETFSGDWRLEIPEGASLKLERGGEEYSLRAGESASLAGGGTIRFVRVVRWVNYVVYKNSFGVLMALSGGAAFFSLLFHLLTRSIKIKGYNAVLWKRLF